LREQQRLTIVNRPSLHFEVKNQAVVQGPFRTEGGIK
jgi:hypothetical protein